MATKNTIAESFARILSTERQQLEIRLASLPAGSAERYTIQKKLSQIETARSIDGWLSSKDLQSRKANATRDK